MGIGCQYVCHLGLSITNNRKQLDIKRLYWREGLLGGVIREAEESKMEEQEDRQTQMLPVGKGCPTSLWPQAVTAACAITITANASGLWVPPHPPPDFKV